MLNLTAFVKGRQIKMQLKLKRLLCSESAGKYVSDVSVTIRGPRATKVDKIKNYLFPVYNE